MLGMCKREAARRERAQGRRYAKIWNEILDQAPPKAIPKCYRENLYWTLS